MTYQPPPNGLVYIDDFTDEVIPCAPLPRSPVPMPAIILAAFAWACGLAFAAVTLLAAVGIFL